MGMIKGKTRSYLHFWEPLSAFRFGHIALELSNCLYISFWPETGTTSCQILNEICPAKCYNTVEEEIDDLENGQKGHTVIFVYGLDEASIKSWWEKFISHNPKYNIRTQNCASVVYTALCAGSGWFTENIKECCGIKTPELIFQYVKYGYNENKRVDNTRYLCTHCVSLVPYTTFGSFSSPMYKLYLHLESSLRQFIKYIKIDQNKEEVEREQQLVPSSQTKAAAVVDIFGEDINDNKRPVEEDIFENCIDLSCKRVPKVVSLEISTKSFISQCSEESHIETFDPTVIDLSVRRSSTVLPPYEVSRRINITKDMD